MNMKKLNNGDMDRSLGKKMAHYKALFLLVFYRVDLLPNLLVSIYTYLVHSALDRIDQVFCSLEKLAIKFIESVCHQKIPIALCPTCVIIFSIFRQQYSSKQANMNGLNLAPKTCNSHFIRKFPIHASRKHA
jgi:hypothetical protein